MKTYNFIYTVNNIECQINVSAESEESAREAIEHIIPDATKIALILQ